MKKFARLRHRSAGPAQAQATGRRRYVKFAFPGCHDFDRNGRKPPVHQVETPMGAGTPTFTSKQEGEKLTGRHQVALGEGNVEGTVKGDAIAFSIKISQKGPYLQNPKSQ
jgi:hypothetical protein